MYQQQNINFVGDHSRSPHVVQPIYGHIPRQVQNYDVRQYVEPLEKKPRFLPPLIQNNRNINMNGDQIRHAFQPSTALKQNCVQYIAHPQSHNSPGSSYSYRTANTSRSSIKTEIPDKTYYECKPSTSRAADTNLTSNFARVRVQENVYNPQPIGFKQNTVTTTAEPMVTGESISTINRAREMQISCDVGNSTTSNLNVNIYGSTQREKMFIFTGTVERVIKWNKIFRNHFCYYEVIAMWIGIEKGSIKSQNILLLKDRNKSPVMQVIYYNMTPANLGDEGYGQMLRCIGRMTGPNIFNAISIRVAAAEEVESLKRLTLVCDQAVSHYLTV